MDPKIKCLKCGSYIHDTERCWNWHERRWCYIDQKYKENCDCNWCVKRQICQYCNNFSEICRCGSERCSICNEHVKKYYDKIRCCWDHNKSPCNFCNLPIYNNCGICSNSHFYGNNLCRDCNMPESQFATHKHDDSTCKKCDTLLNFGKCIYRCDNGGNLCIHCHFEGVVNNKCLRCYQEQTGFLTKAAIK